MFYDIVLWNDFWENHFQSLTNVLTNPIHCQQSLMIKSAKFIVSRINRFSKSFSSISSSYNFEQQYKLSIEDPAEFWSAAAKEITWFKPYEIVLGFDNNQSLMFYR